MIEIKSNEIRQEAKTFYQLHLKNILESYGEVILTGSYELDLMVWRDLDIYMDVKNINQMDIYELSTKIFHAYRPLWFETKDTFNEESGCPKGYFIGFESKIFNEQMWNVDIWFTDRNYINKHQLYMREIKKHLDDNVRKIILNLKKELIKLPVYGHQILSVDIYQAVLYHGIKDMKSFKKWVLREKNEFI